MTNSNHKSDDTGPMPDTWKEALPWMLSPFRVFLFLIHFLILWGVAEFSQVINVWVAVAGGMALMWALERAREPKPWD